ncbi:JAB domain-containing protein [Robertkochia solimangrovi]|uniref:JAB domain-containing protein n=1 Tax=Robertkochia solimangrovi TaxID=2213046 RepID=UPI00117D12D9|nr:JAB domain-containing protein [Robertkochia solimangrovi]TRZ42469.1 DNA repair protein [Robertkochia solimangrovi]
MHSKVNEIKISYLLKRNINLAPRIGFSGDAADILFEFWDTKTIALQESFYIILLNNSNRIKGIYRHSKGGITGTLVDIRIILAVALKSLSTGIILAHNHPSGKLEPSQADKNLTDKIKQACSYLDLAMLDHIILAPNGNYYSFADNGLL